MQRIIELSIKPKSSRTTKHSRPISEVTVIIQEVDITVEANIMVEEDTITKVNTKTILKEGQDVGYVIKITISMQISHIKIEFI